MTSPFLSSPISFKPSEASSSSFRAAHDKWDMRLGAPTVQTKNWRIAALINSAILLLVVFALLLVLNQQKVIPVIVGLDKETGEPHVIGPVDSKPYEPSELAIKYFLSQFIQNVRSVPLDPILIKRNWLKAYSFMRKDAAGLLNEMTEKDPNSPLKKIGKILISVDPAGVIEVPGTNSYQMRWKETVYSAQGTKLDEHMMAGIFIIEIEPPKDEQTLQNNPLGLFIKSFSWNREL